MKNLKLLLCFFGFLILATSCKKEFMIDYEIQNDSRRTIEILYKRDFDTSVQRSVIESGSSLVLLSEIGEGATTKGRLEDINSVPFETLTMSAEDSLQLNFDPLKFERWKKKPSEDKQNIGTIQLRLTAFDFD